MEGEKGKVKDTWYRAQGGRMEFARFGERRFAVFWRAESSRLNAMGWNAWMRGGYEAGKL